METMVIVAYRVWTMHGEIFCIDCAKQWLHDPNCWELSPDEVAEWVSHRPTCSDCEARLLDYREGTVESLALQQTAADNERGGSGDGQR